MTLSWVKFPLPDKMQFTDVRAMRFMCSACGGRRVHAMPDWSGIYTHYDEVLR